MFALCALFVSIIRHGNPIRLRKDVRRQIRGGMVRGYAFAPGQLFRRQEVDRLLDPNVRGFEPLSFETFHGNKRQRVVLRIELDEDTIVADRPLVARQLAQAMVKALDCDVAAVEWTQHARHSLPQSGVSVFSPDGFGWARQSEGVVLLEKEPGRGPRIFHAVPGTHRLDAAGWYAPDLDPDLLDSIDVGSTRKSDVDRETLTQKDSPSQDEKDTSNVKTSAT